MIKKGSFVEIENTILKPSDRSSNLPEDTKSEAFKMWAKGFLLEDSLEGDICKIKSINGRILEGILKRLNPSYEIDYGGYIEEISYIGTQAKELVNENEK